MGLKSRQNHSAFEAYIHAAPIELQEDLRSLDRMVREIAPQLQPTETTQMMGYGPFHYKYASGREGDAVKIGIACLKSGFSLHCLAVDANGYVAEQFKERFPKANIGKSCVRFKRLEQLDEGALRDLIRTTASAGWS